MPEHPAATRDLLALLKAYAFPGGDDSVRGVVGLRTLQQGTLRMARDARWNAFTAEEFVGATESTFCWEAHVGSGLVTSVRITDGYDKGRGHLIVRKGPVRLSTLEGPEVDRGEVQRYLAYVIYCPAMILNNRFLNFEAVRPRTLRVRDRQDHTGAWVDVDIAADGRPERVQAIRPMTIGRRTLDVPWSATGTDFRNFEGLRIPQTMEASWNPPEGDFSYFRVELTSITVVR